MDNKRRTLLKGGVAAGGLGVFAAGYADPARKALKGVLSGTAGEPTLDRMTGNALPPEFRIDPESGELTQAEGQVVSLTQCLGCWTQCGIRARVDTVNNRILRIAGNPYHPLSHEDPHRYDAPVREAYSNLGGDRGIAGRSTACARGAAMLETLHSPQRVLKPMKRVGPRGSGEWQTISFEQLIEEVTEGGDLFGEGPVQGLRDIRDTETLMDPENPEYGPVANRLLVTDAGPDGRRSLLQRFTFHSFGTRNFGHHGSYCGLGYRVGSGALFDDMRSFAHAKPDYDHAEFIIFMGTAPAHAGNPYKQQGRQLASARTDRGMEYVVVAPSLPNSSSLATRGGNNWVPIRPAGDSAMAMAMIRWIIDNERYDRQYLIQPGPAAQAAAGEPSWSNATHLVISDPDHPMEGRLLRGEDMGWTGQAEDFVVVDGESGDWMAHTEPRPAELFVTRQVALADGATVTVKSSMQRLAEESRRLSLAEYSAECDVPVEVIEALARKFTSHGKRAVLNTHSGVMNGSAFYTAYALVMLNALVGNLNAPGGMYVKGQPFQSTGNGVRYDLADFPGKIGPQGIFLSRSRTTYEQSSEYQRKVDAGENPYPARAPWYPVSPPLFTEHLCSALEGYPYAAKIWINHMGNPIYGQAGLRQAIDERLRDPSRIGLIIGIEPFINETTAYADYVVPDTMTYESWGFSNAWAGVKQRMTSARWPVVEPRVEKTADGEPINMEAFLIAVAKRLDLPGFGDRAIPGADGALHPLNRGEDWYLRAAANMAFDGDPVPEADEDDMRLTGVDRVTPTLQAHLGADEWRRAAFVYCRGGRFGPRPARDAGPVNHWQRPARIWNEMVGTNRHSMTGERLTGCPTWHPPRFTDGSRLEDHYPRSEWPMRLTSYKSHLQSPHSIGASRLRQIHPYNPVGINTADAADAGIRTGDRIRVITPGGSVEGVALLRDGVMPGAVAIEHGFGHRELGARTHHVDGVALPGDEGIGAGVNLNDLGLVDPTHSAGNSWLDWVTGASVRQGLPARVQRIG